MFLSESTTVLASVKGGWGRLEGVVPGMGGRGQWDWKRGEGNSGLPRWYPQSARGADFGGAEGKLISTVNTLRIQGCKHRR